MSRSQGIGRDESDPGRPARQGGDQSRGIVARIFELAEEEQEQGPADDRLVVEVEPEDEPPFSLISERDGDGKPFIGPEDLRPLDRVDQGGGRGIPPERQPHRGPVFDLGIGV